MPTHEVPPTELDKAICMDLLEAKQSCMDRGEPFQFPAGLFCERCGEVFRTLDFTQELCRMDESEPWPKGLEGRILTALRAESA
ncbi:MAG: hypothetical protein R3F17_12405 [Planctomycetota bacterium]